MILASLFIFAFALAGCGSGTAEKPAARTERTITPEELLQGQWHGQMVLAEDAERTLKPAQVKKLKAMTMGMEFQEGGKLILAGVKDDGEGKEEPGRWEVVKASDSEITIRTIEASGKSTEAVLMFESDDVFLIPLKTELANLGAMRFERLR
jgi:hypothetical protein